MMAMATKHSTFSDLFNDASGDPFLINGSYDDFLAPFTIAPSDGNVTPAAVRHQLAASATQHLPIALLALIEGRLTPVYLPFWRDRAMGIPPHDATDDKMFGFEGDLVGSQGSLVNIPDEWFHRRRWDNSWTACSRSGTHGCRPVCGWRHQCVHGSHALHHGNPQPLRESLPSATGGGYPPGSTLTPSSQSSRPMVWPTRVSP